MRHEDVLLVDIVKRDGAGKPLVEIELQSGFPRNALFGSNVGRDDGPAGQGCDGRGRLQRFRVARIDRQLFRQLDDQATQRQQLVAGEVGVFVEGPTAARDLFVFHPSQAADQRDLIGEMQRILEEQRAVAEFVGLVAVRSRHGGARRQPAVDGIVDVEHIGRGLADQVLAIDRAILRVAAEQHVVAQPAEPEAALQIDRAVADIADRALGAVIAPGHDAGNRIHRGDAELVGAEGFGVVAIAGVDFPVFIDAVIDRGLDQVGSAPHAIVGLIEPARDRNVQRRKRAGIERDAAIER